MSFSQGTVPDRVRARHYDLLVVGAGPAGLMAAITAADRGGRVIVCEQMPRPGLKLLASGGGRCNLTNTLPVDELMARFGRTGRFMAPALEKLDAEELRKFFLGLGVPTHAPDGFHVFPVSHQARSVQEALVRTAREKGVLLLCNRAVTGLWLEEGALRGVETAQGRLPALRVLIACGGQSYPGLGGTGGGYALAAEAGHDITPLYPAMVPLLTRETWPATCRAHTIPAAQIWVNLPKLSRIRGRGDLIFTRTGLAGPVVLDLAREISPLLERHGSVPLLLNLTRGLSETDWIVRLEPKAGESLTVSQVLQAVLPPPLVELFGQWAGDIGRRRLTELARQKRLALARLLAQTPLEVVGTEGFPKAMVTRGGVSLKQINPHTLESKLLPNLAFAGEVVDLDGPCGGYNLQWAFASGHLVGVQRPT
jgi:predicted Rossmann fold flavoprotein